MLSSSSIKSRVADLHAAFADDSVDAILATIGGFNSNELLPYIDYDLIAKHPKIICGYSDSTAFLNAIFAKTGNLTYMGPSYSSFKMKEGQDYQIKAWLNALTKQLMTLFQVKSGQATLGMTQHNHAILCQQNRKFTTQGKLLAPLLVEIYLLLDSFAEHLTPLKSTIISFS